MDSKMVAEMAETTELRRVDNSAGCWGFLMAA